MLLENRVALITGGSRGIGRACALALAEEGAKVAFTYLRKKGAAEEVVELLDQKSEGLAIRAHVERRGEVAAAVQEAVAHFGKLDIVVNNAVSAVLKPLVEMTERHFQYTLDVNLKGFFYLIQEVYPHLKKSQGCLLSITSLGSRRALPGYGALGACKAAVEALTRQLAVEWGGEGIRVNALCGGPIATDALKAIPGEEKLVETWNKLTPFGRIGMPEDLGAAVVLLCSPLARWIHGETVVVDAGLSAR